MKVLNLRCANGHGFEGWFASDDDFMDQNGRAMIDCPLCADKLISRMPSAPRLNLSGARPPTSAASAGPGAASQTGQQSRPQTADVQTADVRPADLQAAWLAGVRKLIASTEDVGPRFAEEARRIHYGETPQRGIRGQASAAEREALQEEGIETMAVPVPRGLDGPLQ